MSSGIRIRETIEDKNSWFNIKRFRIGEVNFERPVKTLDVKNNTREAYNQIVTGSKLQVAETSKTIRSFDHVKNICEEDADYKISNFFGKKTWLDSIANVVNFTFEFNPFAHITRIDDLAGFFDLYYEYSKLFLTVPNLKIKSGLNNPIISIPKYLEFVDSVFDLLNTKNHKPIFVPVSLKTSIKDIQKICRHYLDKGYCNFWVDFEGKAISEASIGRLRGMFRMLQIEDQFKNTICYYTNIKREIISNVKEDQTPASDVLASVLGANMIGINREPPRIITSKITPEIVKHKNRLLNTNTYYYEKTTDTQFSNKEIAITHNAVRLDNEFESQTSEFLKELTVSTLLQKKLMLRNKTKILKELTTRSTVEKKISDWI